MEEEGGEKMAALSLGRVYLGPPPPAPERGLAAATVQVFAVVVMCTAVADPRWMVVYARGQMYVFGVAEALHLKFNSTGSPEILQQEGMRILIFMTFCCYGSILVGLIAFLLDFLAIRHKKILGLKSSTVLHLVTAVSTGGAVGLCIHLYVLIREELKLQSAKTSEDSVTLGESCGFALFSCLASLVATVLSCIYSVKYMCKAAEQRSVLEEEEQDDDDDEAAPLIEEPTDTDEQADIPS